MGVLGDLMRSTMRDFRVDGDPSSGIHHPPKKDVRETFAQVADGTEAARDKAQDWATAPEGVEVEPGLYSALHQTAKAAEEADRSGTEADRSKSEADLSEGRRIAAAAQAVLAEQKAGVAVAAADASGDVEFFNTYAQLETALAGLPDGTVIQVNEDETRDGLVSRLQKEAGEAVFKYHPLAADDQRAVKKILLSRADNDVRLTDGIRDHRVETFANLAAISSKINTGEIVIDERARFLYERMAAADGETVSAGEAHFRPIVTLVHKIDLAAYQPDLTGATDSTPAMNKAIAAAARLGGGTITVPRGVVMLGEVVIPQGIPIRIQGGGWSRYANPIFATGTTRIIPTATCEYIFRAEGTYAFQLANMDIVGRGADTDVATDKHSVIHNRNAKRNLIHNVRAEFFLQFNDITTNYTDPRNDAGPANMFVLDSVLRKFDNALYKLVDGDVVETTIAGCTSAGIVIDSGQTRVASCFFEFNRGGPHLDRAADDIRIYQNAREPFIVGNTSDRTAGRFVRIFTTDTGTELKAPENVFIAANTIKRCAWARWDYDGVRAWGPIDRYAVTIEGANDARARSVFLGPNNVQTADSSPTPAKGVASPLGFLRANNGELVVKGLHGTLASSVNIDAMRRYEWVSTGAGTDEYALVHNMVWPNDAFVSTFLATGDPEIEDPDQVLLRTGVLASGTAGSLAEGQYAYATFTYNGETFTTLHVRLAGGVDPTGQGVRPWYDVPRISIGKGSLETDQYLCAVPSSFMAAGATITRRLRLNAPLETTRDRRQLDLELGVHASAVGGPEKDGVSMIPLMARAGYDGAGSLVVGTPSADFAAFTMGVVGSGSELEFSVSDVMPFCEEFTLTLTNTTARTLRIGGGVKA